MCVSVSEEREYIYINTILFAADSQADRLKHTKHKLYMNYILQDSEMKMTAKQNQDINAKR